MSILLRLQVTGQPQLDQFAHQLQNALDTRKILDEGGAILYNNLRTRFRNEMDPTGVKWPESQAARRRKRSGRGGGTLFDTGKLWRSLQLYAESMTSRAIGTNVTDSHGLSYGAVHNFGLFGFPVRQFLGFGNDDVTVMSSFIIRRVKEALKL